MPNFYSPEGNFEVWEKKPNGYFTPEEWKSIHPTPELIPSTDEELMIQVRMKRDMLLNQTDKYLIADYPIDPAKLEIIKLYRKALRNIPQQSGFPTDVVWPDKPEI